MHNINELLSGKTLLQFRQISFKSSIMLGHLSSTAAQQQTTARITARTTAAAAAVVAYDKDKYQFVQSKIVPTCNGETEGSVSLTSEKMLGSAR